MKFTQMNSVYIPDKNENGIGIIRTTAVMTDGTAWYMDSLDNEEGFIADWIKIEEPETELLTEPPIKII